MFQHISVKFLHRDVAAQAGCQKGGKEAAANEINGSWHRGEDRIVKRSCVWETACPKAHPLGRSRAGAGAFRTRRSQGNRQQLEDQTARTKGRPKAAGPAETHERVLSFPGNETSCPYEPFLDSKQVSSAVSSKYFSLKKEP